MLINTRIIELIPAENKELNKKYDQDKYKVKDKDNFGIKQSNKNKK